MQWLHIVKRVLDGRIMNFMLLEMLLVVSSFFDLWILYARFLALTMK